MKTTTTTANSFPPSKSAWNRLRKANDKALLLYRVGEDTYQAFHDDAAVVSETLKTPLTTKQNKAGASVPVTEEVFKDAPGEIARLEADGHKVVVVNCPNIADDPGAGPSAKAKAKPAKKTASKKAESKRSNEASTKAERAKGKAASTKKAASKASSKPVKASGGDKPAETKAKENPAKRSSKRDENGVLWNEKRVHILEALVSLKAYSESSAREKEEIAKAAGGKVAANDVGHYLYKDNDLAQGGYSVVTKLEGSIVSHYYITKEGRKALTRAKKELK